MATPITDEAVEQEIARLLESPYVALSKRESRIRNRRRQYMYSLRSMERHGQELEAQGITMETLDELDREIYDDPC
jgi:hypothetical protein